MAFVLRVCRSWTVLAALGFVGCTEDPCGPRTVGLEGSHRDSSEPSTAEVFRRCGVAVLHGVFDIEQLRRVYGAFRALPKGEAQSLRHGSVREKRLQTHLPFSPPFSELDLIGKNSALLPALTAALGDGLALDLVTVVQVPAGAAAQEPHRDTPLPGHVGVHIPLQDLLESDAPLGICSGTAGHTADEDHALYQEAFLWKNASESFGDAKRRVYCGGRPRTDVFEMKVGAEGGAVRTKQGRLGVAITGFTSSKAESLEWEVGDEVTHVNGDALSDGTAWRRALKARAGKLLSIRVERPHPGPPPDPPPRLIVGAPLKVGDCLLYDSRTWHWGMAHTGSSTRYVLYINFKSSDQHDGVHAEISGNEQVAQANVLFQQRLANIIAGSTQREEL